MSTDIMDATAGMPASNRPLSRFIKPLGWGCAALLVCAGAVHSYGKHLEKQRDDMRWNNTLIMVCAFELTNPLGDLRNPERLSIYAFDTKPEDAAGLKPVMIFDRRQNTVEVFDSAYETYAAAIPDCAQRRGLPKPKLVARVNAAS